jgi:hypothetical protein
MTTQAEAKDPASSQTARPQELRPHGTQIIGGQFTAAQRTPGIRGFRGSGLAPRQTARQLHCGRASLGRTGNDHENNMR